MTGGAICGFDEEEHDRVNLPLGIEDAKETILSILKSVYTSTQRAHTGNSVIPRRNTGDFLPIILLSAPVTLRCQEPQVRPIKETRDRKKMDEWAQRSTAAKRSLARVAFRLLTTILAIGDGLVCVPERTDLEVMDPPCSTRKSELHGVVWGTESHHAAEQNGQGEGEGA